MIVSGVTPLAFSSSRTRESAHSEREHQPVDTRELVAHETVLRAPPLSATRPDAAFVTHLIAMAEQIPQTRTPRRDTPATAHATYGAAATQGMNYSGKAISQIA